MDVETLVQDHFWNHCNGPTIQTTTKKTIVLTHIQHITLYWLLNDIDQPFQVLACSENVQMILKFWKRRVEGGKLSTRDPIWGDQSSCMLHLFSSAEAKRSKLYICKSQVKRDTFLSHMCSFYTVARSYSRKGVQHKVWFDGPMYLDLFIDNCQLESVQPTYTV